MTRRRAVFLVRDACLLTFSMSARFLLIDGYNLLHAAGLGRRDYGPGDLQRCRERLLRYLVAKLTAAEIARAAVVFDARDPPPDRPAEQEFRKLKVLFANPGGDADVLIQNWLSEHSAPKRVTLVSSDHQLQRAARRHRAEFIDSERFFEQLERRRNRGDDARVRDSGDAKPCDPTAAEAAHWMSVFGDLSIFAEPDAQPDVEAESGPASSTRGERGKPPQATSRKGVRRSKGAKPRGGKRPAGGPRDDLAHRMQEFGGLAEADQLGPGNSLYQADLERWLREFEEGKD